MRSRRFAAVSVESDVAESIAAFAGGAVQREEDRFVDEIVAAIRGEVRELANVPDETFDECIRTDFRRVMAAIAERRLPNDGELASSGAIAVKLAQAGVPIETVMRGRRAAVRRTGELMREAGAGAGLTPEAQVECIHRLWEWADAIQVNDAEAHRAAELEMRGDGDEERTWFVRALLNGTLSATEIAGRASAYGLLPGAVYRAFRARPAPGAEPRALARAIETSGGENGFGVLIATVDGDLWGAITAPPQVDGLGVLGLGPKSELARLDTSFRLADRALETALAFGYDGVVTMDDLSLRPAIVAEGHLGERMVHRYLDPLHELGEFGATLEDTVREYLSHGMRIDESAKVLFVHPNTLRHRLDRFQQLTGADLRRTEDVLELWWALQRRRLDAAAEASGQ
jgi:putative transposase